MTFVLQKRSNGFEFAMQWSKSNVVSRRRFVTIVDGKASWFQRVCFEEHVKAIRQLVKRTLSNRSRIDQGS